MRAAVVKTTPQIPCRTFWFRFAHLTTNFGRSCKADFGEGRVANSELSPVFVESALSRCSSDLIRLKFFLWCGRQPNYFHQHQSFCYMVPLIERLNKRYRSVREIIGELEICGCHTKAQTYMTLLRIYWCGKIHNSALETFLEMSNSGYTPNTFARNIVVDVLFKLKDGDTALRFFREIPSPNFLSYSVVISNLCELKNWPEVSDTVKEMIRKGFVPHDRSLIGLLNCVGKSHRTYEMFQVLGLMISLGYQLTVITWTILIDGLCRIGKVCLAINFLRKMRSAGVRPNVVTYTTLIKGCFKNGMPDEVSSLLKNMEDEGLSHDLIISNTLMDCLAKYEMYDEPTTVFCSLPERNLTPDSYTYSSMLPVLSSSGNIDLISRLVDAPDALLDNVLLNSMLHFHFKIGRPRLALKVFNRMMTAGCTPDCYSYAGLLASLFKLRKIKKAVDIYCGIIRDEVHVDPFVHTIVLHGLIKASKFDLFFKFFSKAIDGNYDLDSVSYTVIIHGLIESKNLKEAWSLFEKMKELDLCPNIFTCNVVLRSLCKQRDVDGICKLFEFMSRENIEFDAFSYSILIAYLCKTRKAKAAFETYTEMRELGMMPTEATFSLLVETLHRFGAKDVAAHLVKEHLKFKVIICSKSSKESSSLDATHPGESMEVKEKVVVM